MAIIKDDIIPQSGIATEKPKTGDKGITRKHPDYDFFYGLWTKCRDFIKGEKAVKAKREVYLTRRDKGKQPLWQYNEMLNRATFYPGVTTTATDMVGQLFIEPYKLDENFADFVNGLFRDRSTEEELKYLASELVTTGRVGILTDVAPNGRVFTTSYQAENILNWEYGRRDDGEFQYTRVTLLERELVINDDKEKYRYRVRELALRGGQYVQNLYVESDKESGVFVKKGRTMRPTAGGQPLNFIPFSVISINGDGKEVIQPPLLPLVDVSLGLYRNLSSYENTMDLIGLPTPIFTNIFGRAKGGGAPEIKLGPWNSIINQNPNGNQDARFLEINGNSIVRLEAAIQNKLSQMESISNTFLEMPKDFAESTEKVRQRTRSATLSNIALSLSLGLTKIINIARQWNNGAFGGEYVERIITIVNTPKTGTLDPAHLSVNTQLYRDNLISYSTAWDNIQRAGMGNPQRDWRQELEKIRDERALVEQLNIQQAPAENTEVIDVNNQENPPQEDGQE